MSHGHPAREVGARTRRTSDTAARWKSEVGPLRRTKLSEEIADRLLATILDGKFAPGERLPPERDLARFLNVGRPTLREALVILSTIGLLEVRHGGGVFVADRHADFVEKAFGWAAWLDPGARSDGVQARFAVERALAELAAARATDQAIARLNELLTEMRMSQADAKRFSSAEDDFHAALAHAAGNATLSWMLVALRALGGRPGPDLAANFVSRYEAITSAITARDPAAARAAVQAHAAAGDAGSPDQVRPDAARRWSRVLRQDSKYRLTGGVGSSGVRRRSGRDVPGLDAAAWARSVGTQARIGMITPSSNTMVEPLTSAISAHLLDDLSVHYARIPVTTISLERDSLGQFELEPMLSAARVLADAQVHAICWNGISAAWKGAASDRWICEAIQREIGVPATSATIAQLEAFRACSISRYALAVPYLDEVREAIVRVYGEQGFECVSSAHLGISVNFQFAELGLEALRELIRRADSPRAEAIVVNCTNLASARLVEELEAELGKPIFDSLILSLWHSLRLVGWDRPIPGWGQLLNELDQAPARPSVRRRSPS